MQPYNRGYYSYLYTTLPVVWLGAIRPIGRAERRPERHEMAFLLLHLGGVTSSSTCAVSNSARFERWSHFKDHGVPGTLHDPLNQAAIADGSCRMLGPEVQLDGYALWHEPERVGAVIAALADAPATDRPSYFVRWMQEALLIPCSRPAIASPANFSTAALASGLQNWYHALCAPASDSSWHGAFDPAEEPQQMALTVGFACIVTCDTNGRGLGAPAMTALFDAPAASRKTLCDALPWVSGINFKDAASVAALARMAAPLLTAPCACAPPHYKL